GAYCLLFCLGVWLHDRESQNCAIEWRVFFARTNDNGLWLALFSCSQIFAPTKILVFSIGLSDSLVYLCRLCHANATVPKCPSGISGGVNILWQERTSFCSCRGHCSFH